MELIKNLVTAIGKLINPCLGELSLIQGILALSVLFFLLLCSYCTLYALCQWIKTYRKKGHLQHKMVTLTLLFVIGSGIFYFLDHQIYLKGLAPIWIYPHQTLPLDVHPAYYRNQQYFLEENKLTSMHTSPTLTIETFKSPSVLSYNPSPQKSYQTIICEHKGRDTTIIIETVLLYGYNATDFIMCVQDTMGKHHWMQVLPDEYLYYPSLNEYSEKKTLQLRYRYLLLYKNEISREDYHWVNLHKESFWERAIATIETILWLFLLTLFFPIMSIWGIVVFIKVIMDKCKRLQ